MEQEKIKSKIDEISNGDTKFAIDFAEMSIKDLSAFPETAAEALKNRDLRKLTYANHQLKTIIGLFDLTALNNLIENSLELFEKDESYHREFLTNIKREIDKYVAVINECVKGYRQ